MSLAYFRATLAALALAAAPCSLLTASPASAEHASPVTVVTHFDIIPNGNNVTQATALLQQFVTDSRADAGAVSVTLITWAPTTNHFQLLEVFDSQTSFDRHVSAAHTIAFRTAVQQFIGSPFDERLYTQNRRDDDHH